MIGIEREELGGRGGSIQSAITLEIPSEFVESLNIKLGWSTIEYDLKN